MRVVITTRILPVRWDSTGAPQPEGGPLWLVKTEPVRQPAPEPARR
jgi:hypothetical protein